MIRKQHRFHGYNSLNFVYRKGQTVRGPLCSVKYTKNPRRKQYRLAVVVSKKVNKSAVVRNRIRRRIYEAVRLLEPRITDPYDIVITVFHENAATIPSAELHAMIHAQFTQAGIIKKNT